MTKVHIWLRAETKPLEERIALTPSVAEQLLQAGFKITVEESTLSAIPAQAYKEIGCDIKPAHSWQSAPSDTIILGLKELSEASWPLTHRHIHFAHVYKEQQGWQEVLRRFKSGDGTLYDLEYLVDDKQRRVAAFGYWAGFAGAAVALKAFGRRQQVDGPVLPKLTSMPSKQALVDDVTSAISQLSQAPKVLVIGAKGRSGRGAVEMAKCVGADVTEWDIAETQIGGPFEDILDFDVLVNCVFVQQALPPFITLPMLNVNDIDPRRLAIICDVSCDPYGTYNPLPIYSSCTTFDEPCLRIVDGENPVDLIAIDHLPSLLPVESSEDFCQQLLPHLLQLDDLTQGVWQRANHIFADKLGQV
ncbi:saccharopine dehydrogenase [Shewanella sp. KX20019]|uniref:saccharopine dehydrogenase n=1 Tax=Shewanella sp. KX20019 TaxID=2803864 RepID=UPI0019285FB6|nr:saccharopine dehydrogenase [Shewanella sp. KX20019]QQX79387.1 saccharopine dehydrogenase [Shewanella sp. KX20019]